MDGSVSEINPSYLANPSIYSLMLKCFLTSLIPSLLFPFLRAVSSLRAATCLLQPISSERDRDTFSFHWYSKRWIHLLRNTFFLSICLFVGGPREMVYIGRALTRCRCMQMSTTLNWNPHSIILGRTSGNSKVELLWPGARLREKERRETTDGGGRRRYATFHTTDSWSDLHQFLPYNHSHFLILIMSNTGGVASVSAWKNTQGGKGETQQQILCGNSLKTDRKQECLEGI